MDNLKIYHNPRCAKSREALKMIQDKGVKVEVIEYLQSPPTEKELRNILKTLSLSPIEIIRKNETLYKEKFKNKALSDSEWIKILANNPILIERPIVIKGNKAVIGRPPEKVLDII